jgi:hypothetical protein
LKQGLDFIDPDDLDNYVTGRSSFNAFVQFVG